MRVVIDANLAIALIIPLPYSEQAVQQMETWQEQGTEIFAPTLWGYEVVSSLRQAIVVEVLSPGQAVEAVMAVLGLGVQQVSPTFELHRQALEWASRLDQRVAYDAAYLALTEHLGVEFWTADKRLANRMQQLGVTWVRRVG